jgi:spore maturation protein CgeB
MAKKLLILADVGESVVGGHILEAAVSTGVQVKSVDPGLAHVNWFVDKVFWHLLDRRLPNMGRFESVAIETNRTFEANIALAVGRIPISAEGLNRLKAMGTRTHIWLTDDPWNAAHYCRWMMQVLPSYDVVYTPRKSNISQLQNLCGDRVAYLPFGYSASKHLCEPLNETATDCDVLFVGGADTDRIPIIHAIIRAGFKVALYGGYWEKDPVTRPFHRGFASLRELQLASQRAKISLILVRRANRDGHVMRTIETAACGACMLVEQTNEHLEIFGKSAEPPVRYFTCMDSMIFEIRELMSDIRIRNKLRYGVFRQVTSFGNDYQRRLETILNNGVST